MSALTPSDAGRLADLEVTIAQGLATFIEVGAALMEIREARLYRESHGTFEDYCREKWQMSRSYVNKMIAASEVVGNLGTIGTIPVTESQARPLASLPPEKQREVWKEAVETAPEGKVTAKHVAETVERIAPTREAVDRVVHRRVYTVRMKALIAAATDATTATDKEIREIPANDFMLQGIQKTIELLDRILTLHGKNRKNA